MKKIWVLEQGSYSDKKVIGVFSSEDNAIRAQKIVDDIDFPDSCITEWVLDSGIDCINSNRYVYDIIIEIESGNVYKCNRLPMLGPIRSTYTKLDSDYWKCFPDVTFGESLLVSCMARDNIHAIKIANEKRLQFILRDREEM